MQKSVETGAPEKHGARRAIKVWDLPVRLFHWILVVLLVIAWRSGESGDMDTHVLTGQAILALLVFRILWGFSGSGSARFRSFLKGPGAVLRYLRGLFSRERHTEWGHNPAGGLMVAAMLLALLAQVVTGLMANDDILYDGPLMPLVGKEVSDELTGFHHLWFNVIVGLIALHLLAILFYAVVKRVNLVRPMITGRKRPEPDEPVPHLYFASPVLAGMLFIIAAVTVFVLVNVVPDWIG